MTATASHVNRRFVRSVAAGGCPRPGLLDSGAELPMYVDAKQSRLGGRMRVPR